MDKLETNLQRISELAKEKKSELASLKQKVKNIPLSYFDSIAHPIVYSVTNAIDCTQCGNCCRVQEPGVTEEEMETLAHLKQIPVEDFKNKYIAWDTHGISFLCQKPCDFLNGNTCSIYSSRPHSCADYPGLHRTRLKWRFKQMEENYNICPIVFNVVEKLKQVI